jgi:hypothetical protein
LNQSDFSSSERTSKYGKAGGFVQAVLSPIAATQAINAEIGLLIGNDVPEVLQPTQERPNENGGPFAAKTVFGWVLNGPLANQSKSKIPTANFVQSTNALERQFYDYCNREFNNSNYEV